MSETARNIIYYVAFWRSYNSYLRNENIERPVEIIRIQYFCGILADLLESTETALAHGVVVTVQHVAQGGEEVLPVGQLAPAGDGGDQDAHSGPDQRRRISNS